VSSVTVEDTGRVELSDLRMRDEGPEWIVGRVDLGEFIVVPDFAVGAIRLLSTGLTIGETRKRLFEETGHDVDVAAFVTSLMELGFVTAIDGRSMPEVSVPKVTLPRLRAAHVRYVLTWPVAGVVALVTVAAVVAALRDPRIVPGYHDLLWSGHGSLVLAGNAVIVWSIIGLHELAHLITARAAGAPGRMSLSTRLQFLTAQTDVTGIWAAPRWQRVVVYLSGMLVNVLISALAMLAHAASHPGSPTARLPAAIAMASLLALVPQTLIFMRTDLYFLLQDLSGSRNLYADGSAHVRWWARRLLWRTAEDPDQTDPCTALSARERRAVRMYAVLLVLGTAASIAVALTVTLSVAVTLVLNAVDRLLTDTSPARLLDGLVTVTVVAGVWVLWCRLWWRRHGAKVTAWLRRLQAGRQRNRRHPWREVSHGQAEGRQGPEG
jgi:putative peptide zinc metalloprotease protein